MSIMSRAVQGPSLVSRRCGRPAVAPFRANRNLAVRAVAEMETAKPAMTFKKIEPLTWEVDNESAKDVFAFAGSAPERANGRVAMLGFTSMALTELSSHTPALEQAANSVPAVIFVSLLFTFATIVPKLVSGSSLAELHSTASSSNLKAEGILGQALALFDQSLELWSGRLAMIGIVGLVAAEVIKGDSFF